MNCSLLADYWLLSLDRSDGTEAMCIGWRDTNVPAEFSIPEYDSRLDPYCPTAWRKVTVSNEDLELLALKFTIHHSPLTLFALTGWS